MSPPLVLPPRPPPDLPWRGVHTLVVSLSDRDLKDTMQEAQGFSWDGSAGCDKQFFNASLQFTNMDPLMEFINSNSPPPSLASLWSTPHWPTTSVPCTLTMSPGTSTTTGLPALFLRHLARGKESQHLGGERVRDMYVENLSAGMHGVHKLMASIVQDRTPAHSDPERGGHVVVVFNPLAWTVTTITLTVDSSWVSITDASGHPVPAQERRESNHNDTDPQPISNNYASAPNETAKRPPKPVGMQIVVGELRTEIRQYPSRPSTPDSPTSHAATAESCSAVASSRSAGGGPLQQNGEAILRTSASLPNHRVLSSDNSGCRMRRRHFRKYTNNMNDITRSSTNHYPVVQSAFLEDDRSGLVLLSQQARGDSSQGNGHVEVMPHRRLWNNLDWGLDTSLTLNDTSVVFPVLWLLLGPRPLTTGLLQGGGRAWQRELNSHGGKAKADLRRVRLWLQHLCEVGEDPVLSQPVTVNLK
ncbi:epididymis-specific alpha-mannosidase [Prionailurus iriomotensis]